MAKYDNTLYLKKVFFIYLIIYKLMKYRKKKKVLVKYNAYFQKVTFSLVNYINNGIFT